VPATTAHAVDAADADAEPSVTCFRYVPPGGASEPDLDALNGRILERLRAETRMVPSSTRVDGRFAIRPCWRRHDPRA